MLRFPPLARPPSGPDGQRQVETVLGLPPRARPPSGPDGQHQVEKTLGFPPLARPAEVGGRAAAAAVYPPGLIVAIVRGLQAQREEDCRRGKVICPLSTAITQAASDNVAELDAIENAKVVRDEYSGEPLDAKLVKQGMHEELQYFQSKNVWKVVPRSRAAGRRVIGTRWVCSNKGDADNPEIRCRLV